LQNIQKGNSGMLFSSMTFIYVFLPILFLIYFIVKKELRNLVLLIASTIFYGWAEPKYLVIMLLTIIINYFGAIFIEKTRINFSKNKIDKLVFIFTIFINLGILIYFKYFNFLINSFNSLFHFNISLLNIIMPIGISFYIFQAMSYLIDVYKKEVKVQKDIYKLALYICLFPQLIAGPIIKYHDIEQAIVNREIDFEKVNIGIKRFIIGLAKKVLIANVLGNIADKIFSQYPDTYTQPIAWLGAFSYAFQIYFDFSGYSDMAIGLGLIFGFKFMENFNYPYISKTVTDFWRRWHISLSTWFKQYVYISLGGNREGKIKTYRNLLIVFLLTGIWHGASWNFVLWGLWSAIFIIIEKILNVKEFENTKQPILVNIIAHIYCGLFIVIGWVMFRADNMKYAFKYLLNMFGLLEINTDKIMYTTLYYIDTIEILTIIAAILCSMPLFKNLIYIQNKKAKFFVNIWLLILFILSTASIASNTYNPFIYFKF